jgi:hypothetical protein
MKGTRRRDEIFKVLEQATRLQPSERFHSMEAALGALGATLPRSLDPPARSTRLLAAGALAVYLFTVPMSVRFGPAARGRSTKNFAARGTWCTRRV